MRIEQNIDHKPTEEFLPEINSKDIEEEPTPINDPDSYDPDDFEK